MPANQLSVDDLVRDMELMRFVVSKHTTLDGSGTGKCPFHGEKTGSFNIFEAGSGRIRFHCFGCGLQGDIIDFVRRIDCISFRAAVYQLGTYKSQPVLFAPSAHSEPANAGPKNLSGQECGCEELESNYVALLFETMNLRYKLNQPIYTRLVNEKSEKEWRLEARVMVLEAALRRSGLELP